MKAMKPYGKNHNNAQMKAFDALVGGKMSVRCLECLHAESTAKRKKSGIDKSGLVRPKSIKKQATYSMSPLG